MKNYKLENTRVSREMPVKLKLVTNRGKMNVTKQGHLFTFESMNDSVQPSHLDGVLRGKIREFTPQSRSRMIREIATYGKLKPIFLTLTYGKQYPNGKDSKKHLKNFWYRVKRSYPTAWAVWKLEYQERGAPHYHLLIYDQEKKPYIPKKFIAKSWSKVIGQPETEQTGTRIEALRTHRGGMWYCTKYLAKVETKKPSKNTNQKESEASPGRFWGVLSRNNRPKNLFEFRITPQEYKAVISQMLTERASKLVLKDFMDRGMSFNDAQDYIDSGEAQDYISDKAKYLIKEQMVPVHLMTEEDGAIALIASLMSDPFFKNRCNDYFSAL